MVSARNLLTFVICAGLANSARADKFIVKGHQTITGPVAQNPQSAPDALQITTSRPLYIKDHGLVVAPSGRGIFGQETGDNPISISGNGFSFGLGPLCPGGYGNLESDAAQGTTGCSGIRAQSADTSNTHAVSVSWNGTVKGTSAGIYAMSRGPGKISVTTRSDAKVYGQYEFGVEADALGNGKIDVNLNSGGAVHSGGDGVLAYSQGAGSIEVTNRGRVTAQTQAFNGVVNPKNVSGLLAAISAIGNSFMKIVNFGVVHGIGTGDGILGYDHGHVTVVNSGTVTARAGYAIQTINEGHTEARVSNSGTLLGGVSTDSNFENSGVWAPRESSTISGLDLSGSSTLRVNTTSAVNVSGNAILGGKLRLQAGAFMTPGHYDVINAGSIQGQFAKVSRAGPGISVAYHTHNVVVTVKRDHDDDLHHSAASAASGGGGGSTIAAARILALDERMLEDW